MIMCCAYSHHLRQSEDRLEVKDQFERIEEAQTVFATKNSENKITTSIN